jgi:5-methylcytosine-specific restriction enzyme subunit McrC
MSPIRPRHVPEVVYDRLSGRYCALHGWCRFFIDQMTLLNRTGEIEFQGFRLNMFQLFERFVFCVFQEAARKRTGIHVVKTKLPLDTKWRVNILPDILIKGPSFVAVGDAKYKITKDDVGRHPDLYQIMAYSTALGLLESTNRPQAFLIYPASERVPELDGDLNVLTSTRGKSNLSVRTLWFDLGHANTFGRAVTMAELLLDDASRVSRPQEPITTLQRIQLW